MASIRTPLGRALGAGSSKHGVGHFIVQRTTAVALVVLVAWALVAAPAIARGGYDAAAAWLRSPINASVASLLAIAAFWHMQIGMRVIIEDYFARPGAKGVLLVLNVLLTWAGGAVTLLSILKVALSPAGMNV